MTRKDYILIAEALRDEYLAVASGYEIAKGSQRTYLGGRKDGLEATHNDIADALAYDNPRFDREHFLAVVRGEKDLNSHPSRKVRSKDHLISSEVGICILCGMDGDDIRLDNSPCGFPRIQR